MATKWYKNPTVIAGIIGGLSTVAAAVIAAWVSRLPPTEAPKPCPSLEAQPCKEEPETKEPRPKEPPQKGIYLVGSATVHSYLWQVAPNLFDSDKVHTLEGVTSTGITILSEPYLTSNATSVLAMASKRLEHSDFIDYDENDGFFEVFLGTDALQVTFGAPQKKFRSVFFGSKELSLAKSIKANRFIAISDLEPWVWSSIGDEWFSKDRGFVVYLTTSGSATRKLFERHLKEAAAPPEGPPQAQPGWPADTRPFKLRAQDLVKCKEPWIALGSRIYCDEYSKTLEKGSTTRRLTIVDSNEQPIQRGLYLYGRMPKDEVALRSAGGSAGATIGFQLAGHVCSFLNGLHDLLEAAQADPTKPASIDPDTLAGQRRYLHLDRERPGSCWIGLQTGGHSQIYRHEKQQE